MNTKRFMLIAAFILAFGLAASASAQQEASAELGPPQPINSTYTVKVDAVEVTDGAIALDPQRGESIFGYGYLGRTYGDLPGSFNLSMNCFPAIFAPGQSNEVTGGMWTLPVYMQPFRSLDNVYMGSLYGTIASGKMGWDKVGNAEVFMTLNLTGGTQNWEGISGWGYFQGTLTESGKGPATLSGELTITYSTVVSASSK